ncbi:HIT family protein [uncultured Thiodictyon sp.]|uniref:HIT family protein n=1 Tax=uncultured Thiodictyon sp. TaxID=1846217 RepID=UPI0025D5EE8F|nr:HIT family protein [uncultured Thiodictyon sp.]
MTHKDCPFCDPNPKFVVAESPLVLTLRDAFPVAPGHTLICPRRHFADLFEATVEEMAEVWAAVRQAAADLTAGVDGIPRPDGFNVGVNVGTAAGQTVMHLHVHLIPRCHGDQPDPRGGIRRVIPARADYWTPRKA